MKKSIVKIISAMLAVILLAATPLSALWVYAAENEFTYETVENGIKITGCTPNGSEIIVPEKIDNLDVVEIGNYAFAYCEGIKKIVIPETVTKIGYQALSDFDAIESVELPTKAFNESCVPGSLTKDASFMEINANKTVCIFKNDSEFTEISIGKDFESIDELICFKKFLGCVKSITVDKDNPYFELVDGVLYDENIETLVLYPSGCGETEYVMPSSVKSFVYDFANYYASTGASNTLKKIVFSKNFLSEDFDSIYKEGYEGYLSNGEAYADYVGKNTVSREIWVLFPHTTISSIEVEDGNKHFSSVDGALYSKDGDFLYYYPAGCSKDIVFPAAVSQLALMYLEGMNVTLSDDFINTSYQFARDVILVLFKSSILYEPSFIEFVSTNKGLTSEEITNISDDDFIKYYNEWGAEQLGMENFDGLSTEFHSFLVASLRSFSATAYTVSESNKYLATVDGVLYNKDKTELIKYPLESKTSFALLPETVERFSVMDGTYMNFWSDTYPIYRDDLVVHAAVNQVEKLIDSEEIYHMSGVTSICVEEITEKMAEYNAYVEPIIEERTKQIEEDINDIKQSYENGNYTEEEYNHSIRYYQMGTKIPRIVECTECNSTDAMVDAKTNVECIPEPHSFSFTPELSVTKGEVSDEIKTKFTVHVSGSGNIKEIYNIRLVDSDGNVVQPADGSKVTIKIKVSDMINTESPENPKFYVVHISSASNKVESIRGDKIRFDGEYIVFDVTHFSWFAIVEETDEPIVPAEKTISSVSIATLPTKTSYTYKTDNLDLSGLALTVTYSDGTTETVTDTSKMKVTGFDNKTVGTQTVTVEYEGATAQIDVTVSYAWWQWIIRILLLGFLWY